MVERLHLVLDQSGSMRHMNHETYEGARELVEDCPPDSRVCVTTFNGRVTLGTEASRDETLDQWQERTTCGSTALYDAIVQVVEAEEAREGTTRIVIVTDGQDPASEATQEEANECIRRAHEHQWTVTFLGTPNVVPVAHALGIPVGRVLGFSGAEGMREGLVAARHASARARIGESDAFTLPERSRSMPTR